MPPPPFPPPQQAVTTNDSISDGLIAVFIGVVVLMCLLSLFSFRRSKAAKERIEVRNAKLSRIRGVKRQGTAESSLSSISFSPSSRVQIVPPIVIPEKCIPRDSYSHDDGEIVLPPLELSPTSLRLSFQRPLSGAPPRARVWSFLSPARSRHNRSSSGFSAYVQDHFASGLHFCLSPVSPTFPSQPRLVHQLFTPVLPDELAVFRYGERLTVLQSFDDGWCLVTRDTSRFSRASRLSAREGDHVHIGLVPAWVFVEPFNNKAPTRPFRGASANALHFGQNTADTRNAVIS